MTGVFLTRTGYQRLSAELKDLIKVRRPQVMADLVQAREYGDLRENAEYEQAKRDQGVLEGRIHELETLLSSVEIVEIPREVTTASIGVRVEVEFQDPVRTGSFLLVSEQEAHLVEEHLSIESPLGRALVGSRAGETVTFAAPAGERRVKVLALSVADEDEIEA